MTSLAKPEKTNLMNPAEFNGWMIRTLLISFAWLGIPALAGSLIRVFNAGWQYSMAWEAGIYFYILALRFFHPRLSNNFCAYSMIAAAFSIGVFELTNWGLVGFGGHFLLLSLVLAVLLIGKKIAIWICAAALLFVATLGMATSMGIWSFDFNIAEYAVSAPTWIGYILVLIFFAGLIILSQSLLHDTLITTLASLSNANYSLQQEAAERKRADQKLRKWAQTFENAEWGIVVGSADHNPELMNPAFAKMHGFTTAELTDWPISEIFGAVAPEVFKRQIEIADQKGHHLFESRHIRKNGTIFPVLVDVTVMKDEAGNILRRVMNVQDITERKQAEDRIMRLLNENRSLAIQLSEVEEAERKHLARELHDEAGQWLTATQAYAHAVLSTAADNGVNHDDMRCVVECVSKAQHAIGNVIRDLRPGMLDELGLTGGLQELARLWRQQNPGVVLELEIQGKLDGLSNMINITVYRIIQEGLTNAAKYAGASHVSVRVRVDEAELILSIMDDGKGMDHARHADGFGLRGMRERAIAAGGELTIRALPGKGVQINARLNSSVDEAPEEQPLAICTPIHNAATLIKPARYGRPKRRAAEPESGK